MAIDRVKFYEKELDNESQLLGEQLTSNLIGFDYCKMNHLFIIADVNNCKPYFYDIITYLNKGLNKFKNNINYYLVLQIRDSFLVNKKAYFKKNNVELIFDKENFLRKRYNLIGDYPIICLTNKEGECIYTILAKRGEENYLLKKIKILSKYVKTENNIDNISFIYNDKL